MHSSGNQSLSLQNHIDLLFQKTGVSGAGVYQTSFSYWSVWIRNLGSIFCAWRERERESGRVAKAWGGEVSHMRVLAELGADPGLVPQRWGHSTMPSARTRSLPARAVTDPTGIAVCLLFRVLKKSLTECICAMLYVLPACLPAHVSHLSSNPRESQCSKAFLRWSKRLQKQALPRNLLIVYKGQAKALPVFLQTHGGPQR